MHFAMAPIRTPRKRHSNIIAACRVAPVNKVALEFNCTPQNVRQHLSRAASYTSPSPPRAAGRSEKFDKHDKRRIRAIMQAHQWESELQMRKILASHGFPMGGDLFRSLRTSFGLFRRRARRTPYLSLKNIKHRLDYCKKNRHFDWTQVIFVDEATLTLDRKGKAFVTRPRGEAKSQRYTRHSFKSGKASVHVWGAIWHGGRSLLVRFDTSESDGKRGGVTGNIYYHQITLPHLLPIFKRRRDHWRGYGKPYIVEDGCGIHKKYRKECLEKGMRFMDHPASSPDLNPIELVWAWIKYKLERLDTFPTTPDGLFEAAAQLFKEYPQESIDKAICHMSDRMVEVIKADGMASSK